MKRKEGEKYKEYKKRCRLENKLLKLYLKGWVFFSGGTYRKSDYI